MTEGVGGITGIVKLNKIIIVGKVLEHVNKAFAILDF